MYSDLPIIVDCPDSYLDVLNVFFIFLSKNWSDRKNKIYVATQNEEIPAPNNVEFVKCGLDANSIVRTKEVLKRVKSDYFLSLNCDDFIYSKVDNYLLDDLMTFIINNNLDYVRIWETKNREQKKYKTLFPNLYFCNKKARYSKSLMANIWKKEEFLRVFNRDTTDGWTIESLWLEEVYTNKKGYYDKYCYYDKNPLNILHSVSKGKWIRKSYKKILKFGVSFDQLSKRERLPFKWNFKYEISMFLFDHISSGFFLALKKVIPHKKKTYTTKY